MNAEMRSHRRGDRLRYGLAAFLIWAGVVYGLLAPPSEPARRPGELGRMARLDVSPACPK